MNNCQTISFIEDGKEVQYYGDECKLKKKHNRWKNTGDEWE